MTIYSFQDNKYSTWYFSIINKAKSEFRTKLSRKNPDYVYYESHHIIPKSFGGTEQVLLTAKEHFICHLLLTKMIDHYKVKYALYMMTRKSVEHSKQERYRITASQYAYIRKQNSLAASVRQKGKKKDKPFTKEHRDNLSKMASIRNKTNPIYGEMIKKISYNNEKEYIVTFPDGHEQWVRNLSQFCRDHGLKAANLHGVVRGFQSHCKGFTARYAKPPV